MVQRLVLDVGNPVFDGLARFFQANTSPTFHLRPLHVEAHESALGMLEELPNSGLAVVGTREATSRNVLHVRDVIGQLRSLSLIIISGFARGIDTAAHEAALQNGLRTLAVLGAGLDIDYPSENAPLRAKILDSGGLFVSEYPNGAAAHAGNFITRNRIIAALARATWVAEAPARSGALNTASWARKMGRQVFATPCFPGDPRMAGNEILLDHADQKAEALWGAQSLGHLWLGTVSASTKRIMPRKLRPELAKLYERVRGTTVEFGFDTLDGMLGWATQMGWSAEIFFCALEAGIRERIVVEEGGVFVAPQTLT